MLIFCCDGVNVNWIGGIIGGEICIKIVLVFGFSGVVWVCGEGVIYNVYFDD